MDDDMDFDSPMDVCAPSAAGAHAGAAVGSAAARGSSGASPVGDDAFGGGAAARGGHSATGGDGSGVGTAATEVTALERTLESVALWLEIQPALAEKVSGEFASILQSMDRWSPRLKMLALRCVTASVSALAAGPLAAADGPAEPRVRTELAQLLEPWSSCVSVLLDRAHTLLSDERDKRTRAKKASVALERAHLLERALVGALRAAIGFARAAPECLALGGSEWEMR